MILSIARGVSLGYPYKISDLNPACWRGGRLVSRAPCCNCTRGLSATHCARGSQYLFPMVPRAWGFRLRLRLGSSHMCYALTGRRDRSRLRLLRPHRYALGSMKVPPCRAFQFTGYEVRITNFGSQASQRLAEIGAHGVGARGKAGVRPRSGRSPC